MMPETKLVKTASRSALAGGGERDRLLDNCRTPETGQGASAGCLDQLGLRPHRGTPMELR